MEDVDNRGVCAYVGAGNIWEISVPSSSILLWSKNSLKKKYFKNPGKFQRKSKWRVCRFIHPWVKKRSTIILRITNQILPNSKAQTSYGQNCFLFLYVSCTFIQHQEIICQNTAYFRNIYIYIYIQLNLHNCLILSTSSAYKHALTVPYFPFVYS